MTRFLIDNCLSPKLTSLAWKAGYEATHLRDLQLADKKDWDLIPIIEQGAWTFVTKNPRHFRGAPDQPGKKGEYKRLPDHHGLVCLNGPADGMDIRMHQELFEAVLTDMQDIKRDARGDDLACQVIEATIENRQAKEILIRRYDLPSGSWDMPDSTHAIPRAAPLAHPSPPIPD